MSNEEIHPIFRMNDPPKGVINANGLTSQEQKEWDILSNNGEPQQMILINIPYLDHNGNTKIIVGAVYSTVRKLLPPRLPDLLPPLRSPPAYAIRDVPGKGKGVIATRDIAFGEIVIIERPILIFASLIMDVDSFDEFFPRYAEQSMAPQDWERYHDLANVKDAGVSQFDGIRTTNGFGIQLKGAKETYGGVFLELSRLNHSCGPNLKPSWNPHLFTFSVQALRPIRAGEELTVAYENMCATRTNRQFDLQRKYKFNCTCNHCTKPSPTSDYDRALAVPNIVTRDFGQMYDNLVRPGLPHQMGQRNTKMFLDTLTKSLVTITREGVQSASAMWHYVYLMKVWGLLGDKKRFKEWGFKAVLMSVGYVEFEGEKACREVEQWIDWVKEPEKRYPYWGRFR